MNQSWYSKCVAVTMTTFTILASTQVISIYAASTTNPHVLSNGLFAPSYRSEAGRRISPNGRYSASFSIDAVSDEMRELSDFTFYDADSPVWTMPSVPGSDVSISNRGIVAFFDHSRHFQRKLTIHFYDGTGTHLQSREFTAASLFGFSSAGTLFGVGTDESFLLIDPVNDQSSSYPPATRFAISEDEQFLALGSKRGIDVFRGPDRLYTIKPVSPYIRKIVLDQSSGLLAAIYRSHLISYRLTSGEKLGEVSAPEGKTYRDLRIQGSTIHTGVQSRTTNETRGFVMSYDTSGKLVREHSGDVKSYPHRTATRPAATRFDYEPIPWPFEPFDSMHTVWNYYEQHMGWGDDFSYLHQGLDIITPIDEPTYAVQAGIVKCVLTLGGDIYWRLAVAPEQTAEPSEGWLYAHLVPESIAVDVGDTVEVHDYLGDIIYWSQDWGHIHFVMIRDSGLTWQYDDDEWGILFNPLLALQPDTDPVAPVFEPVFDDSRYGFCLNETSTYLDPDSLYGSVDIIVKIVDYVGDSPWQQPAYRLYYWIENVETGDIVLHRTLGQILNHTYDFYDSDHYGPYATLLYKRDAVLNASSWMSMERNFYHILTNNNGDSLAVLEEKELAFDTASFTDGVYRIYVAAFDEFENVTLDSMDVCFRNGVSGDSSPGPNQLALSIDELYPYPASSTAQVAFFIPESGTATMILYDIAGHHAESMFSGYHSAGAFRKTLDLSHIPSGYYLCVLEHNSRLASSPLLILR